jgi:hypothetical protein
VVSTQHGWPTAPQVPHEPPPHWPAIPFVHAWPDGVQTFWMQQPEPEQALPAQHGWPAPPHDAQTSLLHTWLFPHVPSQQAWPTSPH